MPRVEKFGERLRALRQAKRLDQVDLWRPEFNIERRSFGQYVYKLEAGRETNVSMQWLEWLRIGFRYKTLSEFFRQLETALKSDRVTASVTESGNTPASPAGDLIHDLARLLQGFPKKERLNVLVSMFAAQGVVLDTGTTQRPERSSTKAGRTKPKVVAQSKPRAQGR